MIRFGGWSGRGFGLVIFGPLVSLLLDWIGIHDRDCSVKFLVLGIVFF